MKTEHYPDLESLLRACFPQRWQKAGASWQDVVEQFAQTDEGCVPGAIEDIGRLLATRPSDQELQDWLAGLGCYLRLPASPDAATKWLRAVSLALRHTRAC